MAAWNTELGARMINKIEQIEQWMKDLELEQLEETELYLISKPLNVEDDQVCAIFAELVKIVDMRYQHSSWRPNYASLGLNCEIPKEEYKHRYILGVFVQ